jgi:uncharacterized protein YdaU (DUF1376 family)
MSAGNGTPQGFSLDQTASELPAPLIGPEIDLRGFSSFMLDVDRLLQSELLAIATPEEGWAAFMLWCRSWKQVPPSSLPNDEVILKAFSRSGKRWKAIRAVALRGFILCSDGRLYHPVVAEQVIKAWKKREEYRKEQERLKRWRQEQRLAKANGHFHDEGVSEMDFNGSSEHVQNGVLTGAARLPVPVPVPVKGISEKRTQVGKNGGTDVSGD